MINQPDILQEATEEIDRVVGKDRWIQESDIPHLNYLKACIKEALRLHPVTPFNLPHVSMKDTTVAGYFIPKGSHILLYRPGIGRHPKVWEEPSKFKPKRYFKDGVPSKIELIERNLNFVAFSAGMRRCPAMPLGEAMTVMALGRLLQGFTWSAPPDEKTIDLSESSDELSLARALRALAKPRLPRTIYPTGTLTSM